MKPESLNGTEFRGANNDEFELFFHVLNVLHPQFTQSGTPRLFSSVVNSVLTQNSRPSPEIILKLKQAADMET